VTKSRKSVRKQKEKVVHHHKEKVLHHHARNHHHHITIQGCSGWWIAAVVALSLICGVGMFIWRPWEEERSEVEKVDESGNPSSTVQPAESGENETGEPLPASSCGVKVWLATLIGVPVVGYGLYKAYTTFLEPNMSSLFSLKKKIRRHDGNGEVTVHYDLDNNVTNMKSHYLQNATNSQVQKFLEDRSNGPGTSEKTGDNRSYHYTASQYGGTENFCEWPRHHTEKSTESQNIESVQWGNRMRCGTKNEWKKWIRSNKTSETKLKDKLWNGNDYIIPNGDFVRKNSTWDWLDEEPEPVQDQECWFF